MKLHPKNWAEFQHYKDRCPPWIKLHRDLLNDRRYMCLPTASKALAPLLWLLACESKDGSFDGAIAELEWRLRMQKKEIESGLKALIAMGFFMPDGVDTSTVLAECLQDATSEERREEIEQSALQAFDGFWSAYPRKQSKGDAQRAWVKLNPNADLRASILQAIEVQKTSEDWTKDNGKFIPHPATWLNGRRWEDESADTAHGSTSSLKSLPGML